MSTETTQYRAHGHLFNVLHVGTGGYLATSDDYDGAPDADPDKQLSGRGLMPVDAVNEVLDAMNEYPVNELEIMT